MFNPAMGRLIAQAMLEARLATEEDQVHPVWYLEQHNWLSPKHTPEQVAEFTRSVARRYEWQHGDAPRRVSGPHGRNIDFYQGYEDYRLIADVYRVEMDAIVEAYPND